MFSRTRTTPFPAATLTAALHHGPVPPHSESSIRRHRRVFAAASGDTYPYLHSPGGPPREVSGKSGERSAHLVSVPAIGSGCIKVGNRAESGVSLSTAFDSNTHFVGDDASAGPALARFETSFRTGPQS
ncbi:hypothetical protein BaRGS_00022317 [Batillaria attramentaria]|uniref:Uncharacterized protein n=1 Tax=Batillaria attramentaria TaxID=370345 RepID=A0ABD0KH79_9CAEN